MKIFIFLILCSGAFQAKAAETVSFQSALYSLTCSKAQQGCEMGLPAAGKASVDLDEDANGNRIGYFHRETPAKSFVIGADIMVVHSTAGYYLLFVTSWIQNAAKANPRLEAHASITVNSLAQLNRINIPSPDMDSEKDFGHGQFLIWAAEP